MVQDHQGNHVATNFDLPEVTYELHLYTRIHMGHYTTRQSLHKSLGETHDERASAIVDRLKHKSGLDLLLRLVVLNLDGTHVQAVKGGFSTGHARPPRSKKLGAMISATTACP